LEIVSGKKMLSTDRLANYFFDGYLPWDGSFLGFYDDTSVVERIGKNFFLLDLKSPFNHYRFYCTLLKGNDNFSILVDNLKNVFGLTRRGTHSIKINFLHYTLFYTPMIIVNNSLHLIEEKKFSLLSKEVWCENESIIETIQQYLYFHDFFGINCRGLSNITVIENNLTLVINTKPEKLTITTKKKLYSPLKTTGIGLGINKYWLTNSDFYYLSLLFNNQEIRKNLEEVIKKTDNKYFWLSDHIFGQMIKWL